MAKEYQIVVTITELPKKQLNVELNCSEDLKLGQLIKVLHSLTDSHVDLLNNYMKENNIPSDEMINIEFKDIAK
tara:strand:+ start:16775 stop:16996 length:222 start_codon:yes stop_codon:yes gene_type:complete